MAKEQRGESHNGVEVVAAATAPAAAAAAAAVVGGLSKPRRTHASPPSGKHGRGARNNFAEPEGVRGAGNEGGEEGGERGGGQRELKGGEIEP